ncbi:MAG: LytR C-terminal domain-containing protein [Gemmatimonadales bacterium]|nr:LytR C-terminal domain-containing protein [Gemmatimonadales bacterium]MDZ4257568.1 LytR C-terminal domain-containing protein [Gemmatimonadales bacterium]MDZ4389080.1 LytR C-terminal domain-containing protein [Gemmatimonadales bacterium]
MMASPQFLLMLVATGAATACGHQGGNETVRSRDSWDPLPRRVTVEVRNAAMVTGAARDATIRLRRAGLDVVVFDNPPPELRDPGRERHRILVRRGDTLGCGRIIEAIGPADILEVPDASRLVDLTVLLGNPASPPEPSGS